MERRGDSQTASLVLRCLLPSDGVRLSAHLAQCDCNQADSIATLAPAASRERSPRQSPPEARQPVHQPRPSARSRRLSTLPRVPGRWQCPISRRRRKPLLLQCAVSEILPVPPPVLLTRARNRRRDSDSRHLRGRSRRTRRWTRGGISNHERRETRCEQPGSRELLALACFGH